MRTLAKESCLVAASEFLRGFGSRQTKMKGRFCEVW